MVNNKKLLLIVTLMTCDSPKYFRPGESPNARRVMGTKVMR